MARQTTRGLTIPESEVVKLQGREFIKYGGLVSMANEYADKLDGFLSVVKHETRQEYNEQNDSPVQIYVEMGINKLVIDKEGLPHVVTLCKFPGLGDASKLSTTKMIHPHLNRMAETRAIARALRVMTAVNMTSFEELGDLSDVIPDNKAQVPKVENKPKATQSKSNGKSEQRKDLDKTFTDLVKTSGIDPKTLPGIYKEVTGKDCAKSGDLSDAELGKVIEHLVKSGQETSSKPATKKEASKRVNELKKQLNYSASQLKEKISEWLSKDGDFKPSDLTLDDYETIIAKLEDIANES